MIDTALTFDDVLIIPAYSDILPSSVNTKITLCPGIELDIPIISAAMDTVTETKLAIKLAQLGGLGCIHKNMSSERQAQMVQEVKKEQNGQLLVAAAVGILEDGYKRAQLLIESGVNVLVVDSAHGHSANVLQTIKHLKQLYNTPIIGGNIATAEGALALIDAGADVIKVGIGPGSICTTRIVAGVGVPQLSAVIQVAEIAKKYGKKIIADGGMRNSGDLAKAIAAGASAGMFGRIFAGCDETPGQVQEEHGKKYKYYRGMGSLPAMQAGSKDRYLQQDLAPSKLVAEGVEAHVVYKGSISEVTNQLVGGVKLALAYTGSANIEQMQQNAKFTRITTAGRIESHPHGIEVI